MEKWIFKEFLSSTKNSTYILIIQLFKVKHKLFLIEIIDIKIANSNSTLNNIQLKCKQSMIMMNAIT